MKKKVFVLTNLMFLVLAGCGKNSESTSTDKPSTEKKTESSSSKTTETPKPETVKNKSKGATFNSDINFSFLVADLNSTIKDLPVDVNYAVNSDGLLNLEGGNTAVEFKADVTKANAYQDSDGNTVSSTDAAINNMEGVKALLTVPQSISTITSLLSVPLSDVVPAQYKALGYAFTEMMGTIPEKTDSNETARANALKALGSENFSFYLNQSGVSGSETHGTGDDAKVRTYKEYEFTDTGESSKIKEITEVISILQELEISELQKLDYMSLLTQIANGDIISDETNETIKEKYALIKKYADILVGGANIEKYGTTYDDGTADAGFKLYLNEYGLGQLDKAFQDSLSDIASKSSILSSMISQIKFTDFTFGLEFYKGSDQYTHFGGIYLNFAFDMGDTEDGGKKNNITLDLKMNRDSGESIASDYFNALETKNEHYQQVKEEFKAYYEKIGKAVSYYDGDFTASSLDISEENGNNLDAAVVLYDTLSDDCKFMMTDAIKKDEIKTKYNEAREKLQKAITAYGYLYKAESIKGSHSLSSVSTAFSSVSDYKNWNQAFLELDSSTYSNVLKVETDTLNSLSDSIQSYADAINSLKSDATDSEIKKVLSTSLTSLRNEVKDYKPSTVFGIPTAAKYQNKLFLTDELKEKKNSLLDESEGSILYTIDRANQDYFINHLNSIVSDTTKSSQEIEESFHSFVNAYYASVVTSAFTGEDSSVSYVYGKSADFIDSYASAVKTYFQALTDDAISTYSALKNDATDTNRTAYNNAITKAKSVLSTAISDEEKIFNEKLSEDYYDFILQLEEMGKNL